MYERDPLNLIIWGRGGQGNVLLSRLLAGAFARRGYNITTGNTFGASQRGGSVMSHVRISKKRFYGALIPKGNAHVMLSLEPMETIRILATYGNPEVVVISNIHPVYPPAAITGDRGYPDLQEMKRVMRALSARCWFLDATEISLEMGNRNMANTVMMGALLQTRVINLSKSDIEGAIREVFSPKIVRSNLLAIKRGMQAVQTQ
ncbi:hypothetical protein ES703_107726 [subsurface metagenome]